MIGNFPTAHSNIAPSIARTSPEKQLPTLVPPASSPAPISLQMNPPSPIEALNAELDPRNITMSVRARNPKRTFNDYSAAETKATKPDSKRVSILFTFRTTSLRERRS
jgi:hypothetical protein